MKVINRQTFSIAKPLESVREAAVQTARGDRRCRVRLPLTVRTGQKGTGDDAGAATEF